MYYALATTPLYFIRNSIKMKKKIMVIYFLLSALTYAQMPFEVGNRWDFEAQDWWSGQSGSRDTLVYKISSDTIMPNGFKYFRINPAGNLFKDFVRADSVGIYYYDTLNNREWLFFKYDIGNGSDEYPNSEHISVGYMMITDDSSKFINIYKWSDGNLFLFGDSVRTITYFYDTGQDDSYSITISPKLGFVGTHESGQEFNYDLSLLGCKISGTIYGTLTSIVKEKKLPRKITLSQNYPNPFNPNTIIQYEIPRQSKVNLVLFDILGNKITDMVNETKSPGKYQYKLYASGFSSGMYIYQLLTDEKVITRKMILLK
jgi:hypothetical protein